LTKRETSIDHAVEVVFLELHNIMEDLLTLKGLLGLFLLTLVELVLVVDNALVRSFIVCRFCYSYML
jgi:predicted tellurium resistance membrane protein TerC